MWMRLKYYLDAKTASMFRKIPDDLLSTLTDMALVFPTICIYRTNGGNASYASSLTNLFLRYFNATEFTAIMELAVGQYHVNRDGILYERLVKILFLCRLTRGQA